MAEPATANVSAEALIKAYRSQRDKALDALAMADARVETIKGELFKAHARITELEAKPADQATGTAPPKRGPVKRVR